MAHSTCCVVNCKNTGRTSQNVKYYRFPTSRSKIAQRMKWIAAVKRLNPDGSLWSPKASDTICSAHFVNNSKANDKLNPSYSPSIFPSVYKPKVFNEQTASSRHNRYLHRQLKPPLKPRIVMKKSKMCIDTNQVDIHTKAHNQLNNDNRFEPQHIEKTYCDQECEAFFLCESNQPSKTFVCNRYICKENSITTCEVEIQTDLVEASSPVFVGNRKKFRDMASNTVQQKPMVDKAVGPDFDTQESKSNQFSGLSFDHVKNNEQLVSIAGVTLENFNFLLKRFDRVEAENAKISNKNRLFLLLTKLKTGLSFSAMSVIFNVHRTTIGTIFYETVQYLARATEKFVFWPEKADVVKTMPECFREEYNNTRVIIDCTEFRIESPPRVDDRVFMYSYYKKSFTAKLLVGITPSGFISFKSKVAGGRKSDSQITIESGLIDLLEDDDVVLADKGFPQFQNAIDERGSKVLLVMPPFLEKNPEFTKEETEETYKIAKCRIHVERIMQRIRTYTILQKITHNLYTYIDDIVHVICVLVNLQPPIIKQ